MLPLRSVSRCQSLLGIFLPSSYYIFMTTTLSSKGQLVLPKAFRGSHRWAAGTVFSVEEASGGVLLRPVHKTAGRTMKLDDVIGCTGYRGPLRTQNEIDAGLMREAKRGWTKTGRCRSVV